MIRHLTCSALVLVLLGCSGLLEVPAPAPPAQAPAPSGAVDLAPLLAPVLERHGVPALGAARVRGDKIVGIGVVGVRRVGGSELTQRDDRWHLGSNTKAMTATLYARDVAAGRASWDDTVGDVLAELDPDPGWRDVTAMHLLTHTGGVAANPSTPWMLRMLATPDPPDATRRGLLTSVLSEPPGAVGSFAYSNLGYIIVGAMLEARGGAPYERRLVDELLTPIGAVDVGFGAPGAGSPVGHRAAGGGWTPVDPGRGADNPPAFGPAGGLHTTLTSWARFASLHLAGARGDTSFLPAEAWSRLHTPVDGYAAGWGVSDGADGRRLAHDGSNTMWLARIVLYPDANEALLIVCNAAGPAADAAVDDVTEALRAR
jgi:CubicO group peptidase (beta-lactamase class C family)